jgi:enoyl-CoA hydratase/carnithine racemase
MQADAGLDQRFDTLRVARSGEIAWVTIEHPPINLLDAAMLDDLDRLSIACTHAGAPRVVIFESVDPDFFIAHADVEGIVGRGDPHAGRRERLSRFAQMTERFRTLPIVTIAIVEGRARGGGSEFVLALDLCFAASETAILAQPEVVLGLLPGGGATQRLPRLVGRSRALEIMLGGQDYTAAQAEAYGWITRALPRDELRTYVSDLAERIASFPTPAVEAIKGAVEHASQALHDGLREEHRQFRRMLATDDASAAIGRFLAAGGQTRAYELDFGAPPRAAPLVERLVGTWALHSYDVSLPDGTRRQPLGVSPRGQLIYGSDGHMSAQLTGGTRDVDDQRATDDVSYAGTYLVDEPSSRVVHHVNVSLAPTWIGHDLRRDVRWDGELLVLRADLPEPGGGHGTHELTWRPIGISRSRRR